MQQIKRPRGVFRGTNMMTPHALAYYKGAWHARTVYVELSEGEWIERALIFGVTVRGASGAELWRDENGGDDPSRVFHDRAAAEEFIARGLRDDS